MKGDTTPNAVPAPAPAPPAGSGQALREVKGQRPEPARAPASGPARLSPADLFRLRRAHLEAQDAQLRADLTRQRLQGVLLALERRYGLLGQQAAIDIHTGAITWPEPAPRSLPRVERREEWHGDNALGHPHPNTP